MQLFRKPDVATGQLIPVKEGLDALRSQREPFAIISAVGPTRTGKSSILGRAFLRGQNENAFEIGSGVTSHTGGVWMTNRPVSLRPSNGGKPIRCFIIDTEGFSGVGGLTSRTYEANLFGMVYLMSSAVIFNSMYPVDASVVERMNGYGKRTLDVIAELHDYDVAMRRLSPKLVWSVQSFNMHNLHNSHMSVDQLLSDLKNTSRRSVDRGSPGSTIRSTAASAVLGERTSTATSMFVLESLFRSVSLVPVRRPHADDEVVANLARYESTRLSTAYLDDVAALRDAVVGGLYPAHKCRDNSSGSVPLFPKRCGQRPFTGAELVEQIGVWLKYGHIIDPSESDEALNETAVLEEFEESHDAWMQRECTRLTSLLRSKLRAGYNEHSGRMNESALRTAGDEALNAVSAIAKHLPRKSMARGIESSTFWRFPSKVATYIETAAKSQTTQCMEELFQVRRTLEARQRTIGRASTLTVKPPQGAGPNGSSPLKIVKKSDSVQFERASKARLTRLRARSKQLTGDDVHLTEHLGKAREECFVVFD